MSPRKKGELLSNLLLLFGTCAVLLPLAEIVVRIVRPQTLPSQEFLRSFVLEDMYVSDESAGYRLAPGFTGRLDRSGIVTEFSTNALGLRGDEIGPKVRPRILAFGDSFTWGWGVPQGEEWIHAARREIDRRLGFEAAEGINCGVNGYGTENAFALLERVAPELRPDLVLLGFFANDFTDNLLGANGIYSVRDGLLFDHFSHEYFQENFLARESHLYRLVTTAWETLRIKHLGGVPSARPARNFTPEEFARGRDLSERHILRMRDRTHELGARFAVVWLPADVYAFARRRPEDIPLRQALQSRIADAGIPSLDLLPVVTTERAIPGLYLPQDGHFSIRGNRVAGRAIGRWILEEALIEAPSAPEVPRGS